MNAADLEWLRSTLPLICGSHAAADQCVGTALNATAAFGSGQRRRKPFFHALGWEICGVLQARWLFAGLTLTDATLLSHELAEHLIANPQP